MRREINAGLNVVENWNSTNNFIFYGYSGEMATNQPSEQLLVDNGFGVIRHSSILPYTVISPDFFHSPLCGNSRTDSTGRNGSPLNGHSTF
ncbi:MAG: transposase [Okeania sp. SIO3H1]|nr:transposase [Okeania sp. SIO3H1]NET28644.1 transposase [Okeania sp. SIO1I7]